MRVESRNYVISEIDEMHKAWVELEYKGLDKFIERIFYDSKANLCTIYLKDIEAPWWEIVDVAEHHIRQFDVWGRCIPMDGATGVYHKVTKPS